MIVLQFFVKGIAHSSYLVGGNDTCAIVDPRRDVEIYLAAAEDLGMDVLFEAHSRADIEIAAGVGAEIIGINNRDLKSLEVNLDTTEELVDFVPDGVVKVSESGIKKPDDVERMRRLGIDAMLIGGALMSSGNPAAAIKELLGGGRMGGDTDVD